MGELRIGPVTADQWPEFHRAACRTFHNEPNPDERDLLGTVFEPERSLAAFDGTELVATALAFTRAITVPGGAPVPAAAVSLVGVAPTHRRRGVLTSLVRRQLAELYAGGREPLSVLWAAEAAIYQRFGYGAAAQALDLEVSTRQPLLRPGTEVGAGRIRLVDAADARDDVMAVYEAVRGSRAGFLDRPGRWWDVRLADLEHWREGASGLRCALYGEPVTGYVLYQVKGRFTGGQPDGEAIVREVAATDPPAYAALWAYLLNLDLVRTLRWSPVPVDLPLQYLLDDPRQARLTQNEELWVRLADLGPALAARRYACPLDVVFEVADPFCPWNAGRWRLAGDGCGATASRTSAPADLELGATELAAAYLGGVSLTALADAGRVRESRRGALSAATAAFLADRAPWCPEGF